MGKVGRRAVRQVLPELKAELKPDLTIANAENAAHGKGITPKTLRELMEAGVDFMTSGNHVWDRQEAFDCFNDPELSGKLIRPANWPGDVPGQGSKMLTVGTKNVLVINLLGRVFGKNLVDDPFRAFDELLKTAIAPKPDLVLVDFHAEATSEKQAFGWHAAGRVGAVWGTHTHVPTADARLLADTGTAYITDIGMCGYRDGIIGVSRESALPHYFRGLPMKMEVPEAGEATVNTILIETDGRGQAQSISQIIKNLTI